MSINHKRQAWNSITVSKVHVFSTQRKFSARNIYVCNMFFLCIKWLQVCGNITTCPEHQTMFQAQKHSKTLSRHNVDSTRGNYSILNCPCISFINNHSYVHNVNSSHKCAKRIDHSKQNELVRKQRLCTHFKQEIRHLILLFKNETCIILYSGEKNIQNLEINIHWFFFKAHVIHSTPDRYALSIKLQTGRNVPC